MDTSEYPVTRLNLDVCFSLSTMSLIMRAKNKLSINIQPKKPNSSPTVQNIKSVFCSGTKLNLV